MTVCKAGKATMHLDSHEKFTYLAPARGFLNLPEQIDPELLLLMAKLHDILTTREERVPSSSFSWGMW